MRCFLSFQDVQLDRFHLDTSQRRVGVAFPRGVVLDRLHGRFLVHRDLAGVLPLPHYREVLQNSLAEDRVRFLCPLDGVLPDSFVSGGHVCDRSVHRCGGE